MFGPGNKVPIMLEEDAPKLGLMWMIENLEDLDKVGLNRRTYVTMRKYVEIHVDLFVLLCILSLQ